MPNTDLSTRTGKHSGSENLYQRMTIKLINIQQNARRSIPRGVGEWCHLVTAH